MQQPQRVEDFEATPGCEADAREPRVELADDLVHAEAGVVAADALERVAVAAENLTGQRRGPDENAVAMEPRTLERAELLVRVQTDFE